MLIRARRRPGVVGRIDRDAGLPLPGELPRDFRAERVHAVDQQRIDVWLDGIEIRRQEETRSPLLHLMDVVHDLRMPDVVDRKSTRLNSSHRTISYAVFCLKKKKKKNRI